jgi:6-phospho-beta-glucosidase
VGTKVAVVGGGSTYTPELVDGLCDHEDRMVVDELVLLDPDEHRREVVGGLSQRILRARGWAGAFSTTADPDAALEGADFVVVQLRIGGQAARRVDETLPVGFGCLGQETVGAGGLAKALRTVPVVLDLAERTAARANPGAWFVDFTNPVGIVTQALLDDGHRAVGLCNVAIWAQRRIGHYLGVDPDTVLVEHVGLNHLTWVRSASIRGSGDRIVAGKDSAGSTAPRSEAGVPCESGPVGLDLLPGLFERFGPELALESGASLDALELQGALPSYYVHYYYGHDAEVSQQRATGYRPRADVVAELETQLLDEYRDPTLTSRPEALSFRGGAFYSLAAVRLMASLFAGTGDVQVVDMRNDGAVPGLPDDAVVETTAVVDSDGAHPLQQRPLASEMLGLVQHVKAYERLAVKAARSGSRDEVVRALLANPIIGQYPLAAELADELLAANRRYLPRFFPS